MKVDLKIPTEYTRVGHYREQAVMKIRKAAQERAAAEDDMKTADELMRRAGGEPAKLIRDVAD